MNREILQKINNLAKFIFDENEYNRFFTLLKSNEFNSARLLLDNKLDEIKLGLYNEYSLSQYEKCNELFDIVIDLIIEGGIYEEGKQFKQLA